MVLNWSDSDAPANGVIFCVPCNTDYIYTGDALRKKHFDYRIKLGEGALAIAASDVKWFMYEQNLKDTAFETDVKNVVADKKNAEAKILSSTLRSGQKLQLDFQGADPTEFNAHLVGVQGVLINEQSVAAD